VLRDFFRARLACCTGSSDDDQAEITVHELRIAKVAILSSAAHWARVTVQSTEQRVAEDAGVVQNAAVAVSIDACLSALARERVFPPPGRGHLTFCATNTNGAIAHANYY
jgi:hypothetical protein